MRQAPVYIIIYGNPVDGLRFVGPFTSFDQALDYCGPDSKDGDYLIAPMAVPPEGQE